MENFFQSPEFVNQARLEVVKDKRAEQLEKKYLKLNNQREKERSDKLRHRSHTIKTETDQVNRKTLSQHRNAKQLAIIKKYQEGLFHNRAATNSPRVGDFKTER